MIPLAEALIDTLSSASSTVSWVGVSVKVPEAVDEPAATVMVKSSTVAKSVPSVAVPEPTATVSVFSSEYVVPPPTVAVTLTLVAPAPSTTLPGAADRVIPVGALSSSVIVTPEAANVSPS